MKICFRIVIVSFLVSCFSYSFAENAKKNDYSNGLKGKVRVVIESTYWVIEAYGEFEKGNLKSKTISKYNEIGKPTESSSYKSDESSPSKWINKYDNDGNEIEMVHYDLDGTADMRIVRKFDDGGNEIESEWYDSDGKLQNKWTSEYDKTGRVVNQRCLDFKSDGNLVSILDEHNDYNLNKSEYKKNATNGKPIFKTSCNLDKFGNKIEEYFTNLEDKTSSKETYKYDDKRNVIEYKKFNSNGGLKSKETTKFDENGYKIEECKYNSNGILFSKTTYKYEECDETGNWTKQTEYLNDRLISIIEREIEYY